MKKTFSIAQKEFMAFKRSEVAESCRDQNKAILIELCKLTYLKSVNDQNHWIRLITGLITNNQKDNFKGGGDFDYSWFFEKLGCIDEYDSESLFNQLDPKYNKIKPNNPDFNVLANNANNFRSKLIEKYYNKGKRLLTIEEIKSIINSLDLYKDTQS